MESLSLYATRRMLLLGLLGAYSGLPLALTASTLTAWLADAKVDRAMIGLFAAVATPYAFKFLWAPVLDGVRLPLLHRLGRRKGWIVLSQALLAGSIAVMAFIDPAIAPQWTAVAALVVAALSATQDTVIDAYRVERLAPEEQGAGAAAATFGYRVGMLLSGAGALALAQEAGWQATYLVMAAAMASGLAVTLLAQERPSEAVSEKMAHGFGAFLRLHVVAPLRDFMTRPYWGGVLAFVVLYKLGDAFMGVMFNPFLLDLGFTKAQIAQVVKLYGLAATILGSFAGGAMVARAGTYRTLLLCGGLHMLTNLLLVVQALLGNDLHFLTLSIAAENFTGGMATTAFVAYLSALCRTHYTATQYALLSSLAAFGRTWLSTPSGALAQAVGWAHFFAIASLMALPGLALLVWLERQQRVRHR